MHVESLELMPMFDVLSHVVYVSGREHVSDVWVAGRRLLRSKQLTTLDESAIRQATTDWSVKIAAKGKRGQPPATL